MKIEVLKPFQHIPYGQFHEGEIRVVSDSDGEYFCKAGWVKDLSGIIPTANPSPTDIILHVQDSIQTNTVVNLGVN